MSKKRVTAPTRPSTPAAGGDSPMNVDLLEQIVRLMAANDLNTVDVRDGAKRVILKRGPAAVAAAATVPVAAHAPHPAAAPPAAVTPSPAVPAGDAGLVPIKSPMVGTFYVASSPDAKPFVAVGSAVEAETEVCTIEAMKNFLPIKAGVRGTIARVLVANGQSVEFDQPMFMVKP